jgi:hypothetical protein
MAGMGRNHGTIGSGPVQHNTSSHGASDTGNLSSRRVSMVGGLRLNSSCVGLSLSEEKGGRQCDRCKKLTFHRQPFL